MFNWIKHFKNKELFVALYFFIFIFGVPIQISTNFYNETRVLEVLLLLGLGFYSIFIKNTIFSKQELLFLAFIALAIFFWSNYQYVFFEILLFYLLYKAFFVLKYNEILSRLIVFFSFIIFIIFPISLWNYLNIGVYKNWYPMPWNIRVYNSYFLVLSIFAVWFYLKEEKFKNIYLAFIFLAFLSILLDGGRSATLAYSFFIACICIFNRTVRLKMLLTYVATWLVYFSILFFSSHSDFGVRSITRESTSGRYELWVNAFQCWLQSPIFGCGFYQLDQYPNLSVHPHNLFIQILTETGLIGFSFLAYIIFNIFRKISWNLKENYFVIAALIAIAIDLSFSGIHIYPITQVSLLWLLVFLLKNSDFQHSAYFNQANYSKSRLNQLLSFSLYFIISLAFLYLIFNTLALSESLPKTPPRFWEYGYQLF